VRRESPVKLHRLVHPPVVVFVAYDQSRSIRQ
jgi:hypothetical protein